MCEKAWRGIEGIWVLAPRKATGECAVEVKGQRLRESWEIVRAPEESPGEMKM